MTSIFRAVFVIGLISLCNVGTALAAAPVSETKPAASTEQKPPTKKPTPVKKAPVVKKPTAAAKRRAATKAKASREVAQTQLPPAQLDLSDRKSVV